MSLAFLIEQLLNGVQLGVITERRYCRWWRRKECLASRFKRTAEPPIWRPKALGSSVSKFGEIPNAPAPAKAKEQRLRQMKLMAKRFRANR